MPSVIRHGEQGLTVPALSAAWLDRLDFPDASLTEHYFSFAFEVDGRAISKGTALFCAPKHFAFADPRLEIRREGGEVVISAQAFAKHVYVESDDPDLLLEDNFFDLSAGERRIKVLRGDAHRAARPQRIRPGLTLGIWSGRRTPSFSRSTARLGESFKIFDFLQNRG